MDIVDRIGLAHGDLTGQILRVFYTIHTLLGHGYAESVYQRSMLVGLENRDLSCTREVPFTIFYEGVKVGHYFADLVVEGQVIVEIKSVENIAKAHIGQLLNYLKVSQIPVGLLLNFGPSAQIRRLIL